MSWLFQPLLPAAAQQLQLNAYTLTCAGTTYTLTGVAANLTVRRMTASGTSYAITASDVKFHLKRVAGKATFILRDYYSTQVDTDDFSYTNGTTLDSTTDWEEIGATVEVIVQSGRVGAASAALRTVNYVTGTNYSTSYYVEVDVRSENYGYVSDGPSFNSEDDAFGQITGTSVDFDRGILSLYSLAIDTAGTSTLDSADHSFPPGRGSGVVRRVRIEGRVTTAGLRFAAFVDGVPVITSLHQDDTTVLGYPGIYAANIAFVYNLDNFAFGTLTETTTLRHGYVMSAAAGTFSLTGNAQAQIRGYTLPMAAASFAGTYNAVGMPIGNVLPCENLGKILANSNDCSASAFSGGYGSTAGVSLSNTGGYWYSTWGSATAVSVHYSAYSGSADQYSVAVADSTSTGIVAAIVRSSTTGNPSYNVTYYSLSAQSDSYKISKVVGGSSSHATHTVLFDTGVSRAGGDVIELRVVGTKLTAYINGSLVGEVTDSSISTGLPGVYVGNNSGRITSVEVGEIYDFSKFSLSGQSAALKADRNLSLSAGSFSLSASDTGLTYTPVSSGTLTADTGTFTMTGNAANLIHGYTLLAESGSWEDNFNRANGPLGSDWVNQLNSMEILSNQFHDTTVGDSYSTVATSAKTFGADQEAQITVAVDAVDWIGLMLRAGSGTGYAWVGDGSTTTTSRGFWRVNGGSWGKLTGGSFPYVSGDIVKFRVKGTLLSVYKNGTLQATLTDALLTSGQPGIYYWKDGTAATKGDDFLARDLARSFYLTNNDTTLKAARVLTCATSSFTLTGIDATLTYTPNVGDFTLTCEPLTLTLTGNAANLNRGRTLVCDQASFSVSGQSCGLTAARVLSAATTTYSVTTYSTSLLRGRRLDAAPNQTFAVTGSATNFVRAVRLNAAPNQTFTLTAYATGLNTGRSLTLSTATFSLSTSSANLIRGARVNAAPNQTFTVTANAANLIRGRTLSCTPNQSFTLTGVSTNLLRGARVNATPNQTFTLIGTATGLLRGRILNAAPNQSFALTGSATALRRGLRLDAAPNRALSLTLNAANLIRGRTLTCAQATFVVTTNAAALKKASVLSAAPNQTFSYTGNAVSLLRGLRISLTAQAFTLTGPPVSLLRGERLTAETGTLTLTGSSTTFLRGVRLDASPNRALTLTGFATGLNRGERLTLSTGTFDLTGNAAALTNRRLNATPNQTFTLAGGALGFVRSVRLDAAPNQTFVLTGNAAALTNRRLSLAAGSFTLTGYPLQFTAEGKLQAEVGSFDLTGNAAALRRDGTLSAAQASFAVTGQPAALRRGAALSADPASFALSGQSAGLQHGYRAGLTTASFTLTGQDATLTVGRKLQFSHGTFVWVGSDFAFVTEGRLTLEPASFSLTGSAAALRRDLRLPLAAGSFTLTGSGANLPQGERLSLDAGSYTLTGQALQTAVARRLVAAAGTFTLTGQSANLSASQDFTLATGSYTLTGSALTTSLARKLVAAPGSVSLSGGALFFRYSGDGPRLTASPASFALSASQTSLVAARRLSLAQTAFSLTTVPAQLWHGYTLRADQAGFTLTGIALSARADHLLSAGSGEFDLGLINALTFDFPNVYVVPLHPRYWAAPASDRWFVPAARLGWLTPQESERYLTVAQGRRYLVVLADES